MAGFCFKIKGLGIIWMPRTRNPSGLSHKQARFVEEYLVDLNASAAALRAGYKPSAAGWMGSKNLRTPLISKAIDAKRARVTARLEVSAARTLEELAKIAYYELRPVKILVGDKLVALDKIARHLGMFKDRQEVSGPGGGPIEIEVRRTIVDPRAEDDKG